MRLLILSASAGAGHVRAAQALEEAARLHHPDVECRHLDILELTDAAYRKAYAGGYLKLVNRAPALWAALYRSSDTVRERRARDRFVRFFDRLEFAPFRRFLAEYAPDAVLTTHFLPCQVLVPERAGGRFTMPLGVVITDFDVHAFWVQPSADRFFVGSDEVAAVLAARGIPEARIEVAGIPVLRAFAPAAEPAEARGTLGLAVDLPTVLVSAGGAGVGALDTTVSAVLECGPVQVLAVAGRNHTARQRLAGMPVPPGSRLVSFGFVDSMAQLLAAADLVVAKSGGLTTAECLAVGVPMVVRDPIPGQEERNADYLLEQGAGVKAHSLPVLRFKLSALLRDPARLARMRLAARAAGRPDAAHQIVTSLLSMA